VNAITTPRGDQIRRKGSPERPGQPLECQDRIDFSRRDNTHIQALFPVTW
jgi:hypothetical protein